MSMDSVLILGATGYLGKYMAKASVMLGHPTYAYVRPTKPAASDSKLDSSSKLWLHEELKSMGVTIFQGELDEQEKLLSILRQVDVVISTLPVPQHLQQLLVIKAIREAGNIKRFVPSEFGNEVDRVTGLPPFQALLDKKKKIRRATEEAAIPFTYVAANSFAAYFVDYLLHPHDRNKDEIIIYGTGEAQAVLNYEEDVAAYTVKVATDPRAENRVIIYRPPGNIVSQLDLVSSWEKKTGRIFKRIHVPEQDLINLSMSLPNPNNVEAAILHNIFVEGSQVSYEIREDDLEASRLYPDYKYTSVDVYLDMCLVNAPKPKLTAF